MSNAPTQKLRLAFLGLGVMGAPMARHLAAAGHDVTVYNRTEARARAWVEAHRGRCAPTPAEAAEGAAIILACVGGDADVEEITLGPQGCFAAMATGTLFVDHTTASAEMARRLWGEGRERGIGVLDAPVSGGQAGAENGRLTIMVGGEAADVARAEPVLSLYGQKISHMGPPGHGQLTKMVNQIAIAGLVQGLAEALAFAQHAGLDGALVLETIGKGAAQSWQMDNRGQTMLDGQYDFGFAVDWMRKDLGFCLAEARRSGARLPVTALVDQFYGEVQALGGGRLDTSSLMTLLSGHNAGAQGRGFQDEGSGGEGS